MLIRIVPTETTQAGTKRDSEELVKEPRNDPGFHLNRNVIKKQLIRKRTKLKMKTITPNILSQSDR